MGDGINRAREEGESDPAIRDLMNRLDLIECDSLEILSDITIDQRPDVIYLDPMFPHRKKSAKVKKEMQAFQHIVGSDIDSDGLLERALEIARYRVVIKRPSVAKFLAISNQDTPPRLYKMIGKYRKVKSDLYLCLVPVILRKEYSAAMPISAPWNIPASKPPLLWSLIMPACR